MYAGFAIRCNNWYIYVNSMNTQSFSKTYLKGEFSYGFWNVVSKVVGIINTFFIVSALSLYEYGSFQLLLVSYAGAVTLLSVGGGVVRNDILRFEAEGRSPDAKKLFYESSVARMVIGFLLWFTVFFFASRLSFKFGQDYISLIRIISFLFLHDALLTIVTTLIEMRRKFSVIASRTSVAKVVQLAILLYFFFFQNINLRAVVISLVVSLFVTLCLLLPSFFESYFQWKSVKRSSGKFLFKILTSYGKWEIAQPIMGKFTSFFEAWAIKLFINTEAVAIFSVAQTLLNTVAGFFPVKTLSTLIPMEVKNEEKLRKIYTYGVKYLLVFSVLIGLVSLVCVPILINLFFNKYVISLPYFSVLLLTLPLLAITAISSTFLTAFRRQKFLFFQKVLKNLVAIPLYLIFLPLFGLWGLVFHNFILLIVMTVSLYLYLENMKPKLFVKWYDIFYFGEEDSGFLRSTLGGVKRYIPKRFFNK